MTSAGNLHSGLSDAAGWGRRSDLGQGHRRVERLLLPEALNRTPEKLDEYSKSQLDLIVSCNYLQSLRRHFLCLGLLRGLLLRKVMSHKCFNLYLQNPQLHKGMPHGF